MTKLAVSETTTYRWSFEEDVQKYAEAGIKGIGVWRQKLSDFGEDRGIELLRDTGLTVSSLHWAGGFTGSDGRTYQDSIVDARDAIQLASRLNAECLLVYSGAKAGHTHNHARRLFRSALREMLDEAGSVDLTLAVEPMHSACAGGWTFLTSLEETLTIIDEFSDERLKLAFDTYHFGHQESILDLLTEVAPRIALVQLGDAQRPPAGEQDRCLLGEGVLPLAAIVATVQNAGFRGHFEVELMGEDVEGLDYSDLLAQSKRAFDSWASVKK